ncbi:hypothetical protein Ae717Ps2_6746c [Pseudonocardia sp. Ae717_Ps2]|nr:hypothetical protein Ae717Ps2_6746c [Pseudonocardia sp. Ae717_Ps2]
MLCCVVAGHRPRSRAGLPTEHPDDEACRVSHEAIYQWIYATRCPRWPRAARATVRAHRPTRRRQAPTGPRIKDPTYIDAARRRPGARRARPLGG